MESIKTRNQKQNRKGEKEKNKVRYNIQIENTDHRDMITTRKYLLFPLSPFPFSLFAIHSTIPFHRSLTGTAIPTG